METNARLHPLLGVAAISVIALSAAGVGALTGILPRSIGSAPDAAPAMPASAVSTPGAAASAPLPGAITVVIPPVVREAAPAVQPKPVRKAVVRTSAPAEPARKIEPIQAPLARDAEDDFLRTEREPVRVAETRPEPVAAAPRCANCGTVEAVREIEQQGEGTGLGAVAGGIAGAVVGKQFGNGTGRTIMSVLGAAGGAYAGHQVEKHARSTKHWEVSVRLDDGSYRTLSFETQPAWRSGDRVRYVDGALVPERA
jgi:outer membrane lipoprotein SlyB